MKNKILVTSREEIKRLKLSGNDAVISFYDEGTEPVDFSGSGAEVCYLELDDLDSDELSFDYESFFPQASKAAECIVRAVDEGRRIICQCEYGMSRSAACAAAILEFFTGGGMQVFNKSRFRRNDYSLNVEIYERLYCTLRCMKLLMTDIDFDRLRTGRAAVNRQENISRIYNIMCEEYAALKAGEEELREDTDAVSEAFKTAGGIYISVHDCIRCGEMNNEVFGFYSVTKDKVWHL